MRALPVSCGSRRASRRRAGFTSVDLITVMVVVVLLAVAAAMVLPLLGTRHRHPRSLQNNTQLRGIHQGMFTFAQGNKSGGGDRYYPGLTSRGEAITADDPDAVIPSEARDIGSFGKTKWAFGNHNEIPGYAANKDDIAVSEMNDPNTGTGFMQYAFAELLTGDFIPAGSADYFINPADSTKTPFIAGDTGPDGTFDVTKVSYTIVNVAVDELAVEWKETVNTQAIVLADRAIGNGDTFGQPGSTAHSVWTDEPGDWRGGVTRNDSSTETMTTYAASGANLKYGNLTFVAGDTDNLFAHPAGETLRLTAPQPPDAFGKIASDQGVLFDQDEATAKGI